MTGMEELKKSIVKSLDGIEVGLLPYLPYLLQDLWEIGADPSIMLSLIQENIEKTKLRILDLGCGKGAVSINLARHIDCAVKGIDALPEFIESAKDYAGKFRVQDRCAFEVGDIRAKMKDMKGFDVVVLGAIGPVWGDLRTTLKTISGSLNSPGYVLLDDGYRADESAIHYDRCLRRSDFYAHIETAGFEIIREVIFEKTAIEDSDRLIYDAIEKRANELIIKYPEKKKLFEGYLKAQEYENYMLANELITGTWLLKKRA